ncbi:PQQ-dependent sugar dehydrogenase [Adhaeribacter swui]|uniref:PQQ-dependent sugar dehydrogenase n=1 Tax=Adhaeribacter swui TaxID=2086471 RepID=UPI001E4D3B4D|nr:PQQ-dependent sugar dehydrogenase [Adhaeribacter swui]
MRELRLAIKHLLEDVKDLSHVRLASAVNEEVAFDRIELQNTKGHHTSVTMGPDGKLYACTVDGKIKRFIIKPDGTLMDPEIIYSLQDAGGKRTPRLAIGLAFDPAATATNLIAWVSHSSFMFSDGPDWDGKLTRLSGANLEEVQDVLVNLPRSAKDHLTNSIAFGPDKALYFCQGSNTAMGAPDSTWANRQEHVLSAAILRLDVKKIKSLELPLDVKTADGGTYDPMAPEAPLTIYASGIRNAYDLVWHSNGELYVTTNGSGAGGNTPASVEGTRRPDGSVYKGQKIPAIRNVAEAQNDYLLRVEKGGYYGHPNPSRGEYVLNGGNPTVNTDPAQFNQYPVGIQPDPNYRGFAFEFPMHHSPNGIIEYRGGAFKGQLKGKLLVVRLMENRDIIVLDPSGKNNTINRETPGRAIPGFSDFLLPLDLTEDLNTGNIYVSEYGGDGQITLLKPLSKEPAPILSFNSIFR